MTLLAASYRLVRVTALVERSSVSPQVPPKQFRAGDHPPNVINISVWRPLSGICLSFQKEDEGIKAQPIPKLKRLRAQSLSQCRWFPFEAVCVNDVLKSSSFVFCLFPLQSLLKEQLKRKPRCGRGQRWPIKLPLGRRVSAVGQRLVLQLSLPIFSLIIAVVMNRIHLISSVQTTFVQSKDSSDIALKNEQDKKPLRKTAMSGYMSVSHLGNKKLFFFEDCRTILIR